MKATLSHHEQAVAHQLRNAADKIEDGHGVVSDFDYDECTEYMTKPTVENRHPPGTRIVTIDLEFLLPE